MALTIRLLREDDLPEADRIFRVAFGTFLGLPEPERFAGDAGYVAPRFRADPSAAFAAEEDGVLLGTNFATRWGSFGFFGPLSVRPERWNGGIAKALLEPVMDRFARWGTTHQGLFTFAHSAKHVNLYRRFGFHPRFLTALMSAPVRPEGELPEAERWPAPPTYGALEPAQRPGVLAECRDLAEGLHPGLDLGAEIEAVRSLGLGDTVLLPDPCGLGGFAVCHHGAGTEGGSDACYVKFAAVAPGAGAEQRFDALLNACEAYARARGLARLEAGVNLARDAAWRALAARGFRTLGQGVAMHRPNEPLHCHPEAFVLDDWR